MDEQERKELADEGRLVRLETRFDNVEKSVESLKEYYNHTLTAKLDSIDTKVSTTIKELRTEVDARISNIDFKTTAAIGSFESKVNSRLPLWASLLITILTSVAAVLLAKAIK